LYAAHSELAAHAALMVLFVLVVSHAAPLPVYFVRHVSQACVLTVGALSQ
jgi:hypothetical protein